MTWDYRRRNGLAQLFMLDQGVEVATLTFEGLDGFTVEIHDPDLEEFRIPRNMWENVWKQQLIAEREELVNAGAEFEGHGRWTIPGHGGTHTDHEALRRLREDARGGA